MMTMITEMNTEAEEMDDDENEPLMEYARRSMAQKRPIHGVQHAIDKDVEDTEQMKVYIFRYFNIVKTNVIDSVPKMIA